MNARPDPYAWAAIRRERDRLQLLHHNLGGRVPGTVLTDVQTAIDALDDACRTVDALNHRAPAAK